MTTSKRLRTPAGDLSLPRLVEAYLLACRAEGKSARTIRWYDEKLRRFAGYLRSHRLSPSASAVTPEIIRGFITELQSTGASAFTVRGYPQVVKGLFTWLEEEGYLAENPIRRVKMPKTPRYVVRPLEEEQVQRLLQVIDPRTRTGSRDLAILLLLLDTGMRLGELAGLTLSEGELALKSGMLRALSARRGELPGAERGRHSPCSFLRKLRFLRMSGAGEMAIRVSKPGQTRRNMSIRI